MVPVAILLCLCFFGFILRAVLPLFIAYKAVSHVINSRVLTGQRRRINKAIHALLMHG